MLKLSAFVFGCNQALTLAPCLDSLADADEVIYFDLGSTDESLEIAATRARVIQPTEAIEGGGPLRNYAAAQCKYHWCLWLSSDDILEPGGIAKIKAELATLSPGTGLNLLLWENGTTCYGTRVFNKARKWVGRAHEYLDALEPCRNAEIVVIHTRGPWHDKPADPEALLRMIEADMQDQPNNPHWPYVYARELMKAGDMIKAIWFLQERVGDPNGFWPETADAYLLLARCYEALGRNEDAARCCMSALVMNANFGEAAFFLSTLTRDANADRWREFAASASNENVAYLRTAPIELPPGLVSPSAPLEDSTQRKHLRLEPMPSVPAAVEQATAEAHQ